MPKPKSKQFGFLFFLILTLAGAFICLLLAAYFKLHGIDIFMETNAKLIMKVFIIAFVIAPLGIFAINVIFDIVLRPLIFRFSYRLHLRQVNKIGIKAVRRNQRITKILGPGIIFCLIFPFLLNGFFLMGILEILPDDFLDKTPTVGGFVIFIIIILSPLFISALVYTRIFKKNKGTRKTLKYIVELKKPPKLLTRLWLKASGFNNQEIKNYLLNLNKKSSDNKQKISSNFN
jgi:hypothetical protein